MVPRPTRPNESPEEAILRAIGRSAGVELTFTDLTPFVAQTPEEAMLASFDERVDCPVCLGRKALLGLAGHAQVCYACAGLGHVSRFYADDYEARGKD